MDKETQEKATNSMKQLRLMVSGSAALPTTVMERWKEVCEKRDERRRNICRVDIAGQLWSTLVNAGQRWSNVGQQRLIMYVGFRSHPFGEIRND